MYKNYNMTQLTLPMETEILIPNNDIAHAVNQIVETIPETEFYEFNHLNGASSYHPKMMLKIILYAYTQSIFSGRRIEAALSDSIRMMWLSQNQKPSYRTINRFRVHPIMDKLIEAMEFIKEGHLVFIGDGKEKNFLKKKAKNSKEKKRIHFIDKISLDKLPSYTKEAFIGFQVLQNVCFNHYSASSNKLFEYIMGGIPVIACDFPEISKVVRKNEIGIVINSHDCKEIANAVNKLIDNNILYQTFKNNTIHTRKLYNWEKEKINLLNLYSNLLN